MDGDTLLRGWASYKSNLPLLLRNKLRKIKLPRSCLVPGNAGYAYLTGVRLDEMVSELPQLMQIELFGDRHCVTLDESLQPTKTCDTEGAAEESMRLAAPRFAVEYENFFCQVRRKGLGRVCANQSRILSRSNGML